MADAIHPQNQTDESSTAARNFAEAVKNDVFSEPIEALNTLKQLCFALEDAHRAGQVHGSLNPACVTLTAPDSVRLDGWDRASVSERLPKAQAALHDVVGELSASCPYQAPERLRQEALGPSVDIYGLGGLLYLALTGRDPYVSDDPKALREQILRHELRPPSDFTKDCPTALEALCLRALSFDPKMRPVSVEAFRLELDGYLDSTLQPVSASSKAWAPLLVLSAALLGLLVFFLVEVQRVRGELEDTKQSLTKQQQAAEDAQLISKLRLAQAQRKLEDAETALKLSRDAADQAQKDRQRAEDEFDHLQVALNRESQARALAESKEREAKKARQQAEANLARSLVLQARVWTQSRRWYQAREAYLKAWDKLDELKRPSFEVEFGLQRCHSRAAPPLLSLHAPKRPAFEASAATVSTGVWCLAISADGRLAISGQADHSLALWDLSLGRLAHRFALAHEGGVMAVALSADGARAVSSSSGGDLKLWDLRERRELRAIKAHSGPASCLAIGAQGRAVLSGGYDGVARLWNLETGELIREYRGHSDKIHDLKITPAGDAFVSCSSDGTLKVWDLARGQILRSLPEQGFERDFLCLDLTSQGRYAVTGTDRLIQLWDLLEGRLLKNYGGHTDWVRAVCFSADEQRVVSASADSSIKVWDRQSQEELYSLNDHSQEVRCLELSADGRLLLSGALDSQLKLWDFASEAVETRPIKVSDGALKAFDASPAGHFVFAASGSALTLWDTASAQALRSFKGHKAALSAVALSPDERLAASADVSGQVLLWSLQPGRLEQTLPKLSEAVGQCVFHPNGRLLLVAAGPSLSLWDIDAAKFQWSLNYAHGSFIRDIEISRDGRLAYSLGEDRVLRSWDLKRGLNVDRYPFENMAIRKMSLSNKGDRLVLCNSQRRALVFHLKSFEIEASLPLHAAELRAAEFSEDDRYVLTADRAGAVRVWNWREGLEVDSMRVGAPLLNMQLRGSMLILGHSKTQLERRDLSRPGQYRQRSLRLVAARQSLKKNPGDGGALAELGHWLLFRGQAAWASRILLKARGLDQRVSPWRLARALWMAGDKTAAQSFINQAMAAGEWPKHRLELFQQQR